MPKRTVTLVDNQPANRGSKARLYAYGLEAIASTTGQCLATVRRHVKSGKLHPDDLSDVCRYLSDHGVNNNSGSA